MSKFDRENTILDYFSDDWENLLKIDELNADNSTNMCLDNINMLLDTYAPLTRINKYKLKFKSKPWITLSSQKSISLKKKITFKFHEEEGPYTKREMSHCIHKFTLRCYEKR